MMKRGEVAILLSIIALATLSMSACASAATVTVCASGCDQTTIQAAVDAASDGDIINVTSSTYSENVTVTVAADIRGDGYPVVNAGTDGIGFNITADGANISGFNITGATYGIWANGSASENIIVYNNIYGNTYGFNVSNSNTLMAAYNYWGNETGPGGEASGSGDQVGENVTYSPYLLADLDGMNRTSANGTEYEINATAEANAHLKVTTTTETIFSIMSYGSELNSSAYTGESGISGTFIELNATNESAITWPVRIDIYYTEANLDDSGLVEGNVYGVWYYNTTSQKWELVNDTGVATTNVTIGGTEYDGYVWANIHHFSAFAAGADSTSPSNASETPAAFTSDTTPTIKTNLTDLGSGIDNSTITMKVSRNNGAFSDVTETLNEITNGIEVEYTYPFATNDGDTINVTVDADDNAGNSMTQVHWYFLIDTTTPAAPTNIADGSEEYDADGSFNVSWDAPADPGSGIQYYALYNSTDDGVTWELVSQTISTTDHSVSGCLDNNNYTFKVRAISGSGVWGLNSSSSDGIYVDTSTPAAPSNIADGSAVYDTDGSFNVSWDAPADPGSGIQYYALYNSTDDGTTWELVSQTISTTDHSVSGCLDNNNYTFKVRAISNAGTWGSNSSSSDGIYVDTTTPAAPTNIADGSEEYDADGSFNVSWDAPADPGSGIQYYALYNSTDDGTTWELVSQTISTTDHSVSGCLDNNNYTFKVRAISNAGTWGTNSSSSDGIYVDTSTPAAPSNIADGSAVYDTDGSFNVSWDAPADPGSGIQYYALYNSTDDGSTWELVSQTISTTDHSVSGCLDNNNYTFKVRAISNSGNWGTNSSSSDGIYVDTSTPAAPSNIADGSAVYDTDGSFNVSWDAPADPGSGIQYYALYNSTDDGSTWELVSQTISTTDHSVSGCLDNNNYTFKVRAISNAGTWGSNSSSSDGILVDTGNPSSSSLSPTNGSYHNDATPLINITITDSVSGVQNSSVNMTVEGAEITETLTEISNGLEVTYTYPFGSHGDVIDVTVEAQDNAGNTMTRAVWSFTIDTSSPYWSTNQTNGSTSTKTGQDVNFNLTMANGDGVDSYIFSFDDGAGSFTNDTAASYTNNTVTTVIKTITATRGQNVKWYFWFNDSAGNYNATDTWNFTVANTAPTFTESLTGQSVNSGSTLDYDINCSDSDSDTITYYDNTTLFDIDTSNGTVRDTPTEDEAGTYTILITCGDGYDNTTTTFQYTVSDTSNPYWSTNQTNGSDSTKTGQDVHFNLTMYDENSVGHYIFSFDDGAGTFTNDTETSYTNATVVTVTKTITATQGQDVRWYFWFNDSSGNYNATETWSFTVANTDPTFTESLTDQSVDSGSTLDYDINCSDADSDTVHYYDNTTLFDIDTSNGTVRDTPSDTEVGTYTILITCGDGTANTTSTFQYEINDSTSPYWSANQTNGSTSTKTGQDVNFNLTMLDGNGVGDYIFSFDDGAGTFTNDTATSYTNNTVTTVTKSITATQGQDVRWYFWFNDSSGNYNATETWSFTVANTDPTFTESLTDQSVDSGSTLDYDINCSDSDSDTITYYDNTTLFDIDTSNGTVRDTPTESDSGTHTILITCGDGTANTTSTFQYEINDTGVPDWFGNRTNGSASTKTGQDVHFNLTMIDDTGADSYIFSFDDGAGTFTNDTATSYTNNTVTTVTKSITATQGQDVRWYFWFNDSAGNSNATDTWTFTVANTDPTFTESLTDQSVNSGSTLDYDINCSDSDSDTITYYDNTTLFDIDTSNGTVRDTPSDTEVGTYTILITCGDGTANTTSTFQYEINDSTSPYWSANQTNGSDSTQMGQDVYFTLTMSDGNAAGDYIFAFDDGAGSFTNDTSTSYTSGSAVTIIKTITATQGQDVRWYFWFNDSAGNYNATDTWSFTVDNIRDTTAPNAPTGLAAVQAGSTYSVNLTWTPSSSVDAEGYNIYRALSGSVTTSSNLVATVGNVSKYTDNVPSDGTWNYTVTAFDEVPNEGNTSTAAEVTVSVDSTSPTITVNTISYGPYSSDPASNFIDVDFNDDTGLNYVQYKTGSNGTWTNITTGISGTSYTADWNVTWSGLEEGSNTIYLRAYDDSGNSHTASETAIVIKDTTAPTVAITVPGTGLVTGPSITFTVITDDISTVTCYWKNSTNSYSAMTTTGTTIHKESMTGLADGSHTLYANCSDAAGNEASVESVTWTVSTAGPSISSLVLNDLDDILSADGEANATISGQWVISSAEYVFDDTSSTATAISSPADGTWDETSEGAGVNIDVSSLGDGTHTLYVRSNNTYNSWGGWQAKTFQVDTTSPSINITAPTNGSSGTSRTPTITFTLTDEVAGSAINLSTVQVTDSVEGSIGFNSSADCTTGDNGRSYTCSFTSSSMTDSSNHTVTVAVSDKAGNAASNSSITFEVDTTNTITATLTSSDTSGVADGTYANGWSFVFNISTGAGGNATRLKMNDWALSGSSSTMAVASNLVMNYTDYTGTARTYHVLNDYNESETIYPLYDYNTGLAGVQSNVTVYVKIPNGTTSGAYSTSYTFGLYSE